MPLTAGTPLGPYEIVGAIGAGGMGEVYRARDPRLDRDVAIKILPEVFARDAERLARFEREAKTLASLNHPNIAQIFGIEQAASGHALVMELVEGEDLSARIARGPVPIDDALAIARQIADALEAAHDRGIIHRDLKPANIKVREDGTVKVLDFGLAKALAPDGASATADELMNSPTITSPATQLGVILGTAGYMSPEQAKGRTVDRRADIWAFGVVLLELLTGTSTFKGENVTETLAGVLTGPIDLESVPRAVPVSVHALLRRCLERDARRRLRDIGEARVVLESPAAADAADAPAAGGGGASRAWPVLAAASMLLAAALAGWTAWAPAAATAPVHATIMLPPGTEYLIEAATPPNLAISPDGALIAVSATPIGSNTEGAALFLRRLSDGVTTAVPDSAGARVPFFSPDSRWVAFLAGSVLKKAPVSGGAPTTIARGISNMWGGDWLSGGTIVFSHPQPGGEMLYSVPDQGGEPTLLTRVDRLDLDNSFPRALDGEHLIITLWTGGLYPDARISRYSRKTGESTQLVEGGSQGLIVGGRHLIYARGDELFAQPYPGGTGQSAATKVLGGVLTDLSYLTSQFDVSRAGALVYAPATAQPPAASIVWVSAGGRIETLFDDARIEFPRLSGDGRHVVYTSTQATREKDLWTWDVMARRRSRLTNVRGEEYSPAVSHDGRIVIFSAWREKWGIYRTSTLAAAEVPLAVPATRAIRAWSISADGRWLAVTDDVPGGAFDRLAADIGIVDLDSKTQEPRWLTATPFREDQPSFSPDGTRLAFVSNQLGRADIWVTRVAEADAGQALPVSRDGGMSPFWSSDGRTVYYTAGTALMAAALSPDGRFAEPRKVLDLPNLSVVGVAPDGRFLAVRRTREPVTRLEIILNWLQALDQRSGG